ncbi:hypothetical protein AALO_G00209390 [Alosa alosa]|uniref:Uncharacterized protein n=1 Tax=Alosa alosa TaxID=278164 RepID=A0AAV6G2S0_9TELE|nr:hypothetical protein AALO_G00209390 [Alosa alosa]
MRIKNQSIEEKRDTVIRSLIVYLGEKVEDLFEDCQEDCRSDARQHVLKILVVHGAEDPADVAIVVEGKMIEGCGCTKQKPRRIAYGTHLCPQPCISASTSIHF